MLSENEAKVKRKSESIFASDRIPSQSRKA